MPGGNSSRPLMCLPPKGWSPALPYRFAQPRATRDYLPSFWATYAGIRALTVWAPNLTATVDKRLRVVSDGNEFGRRGRASGPARRLPKVRRIGGGGWVARRTTLIVTTIVAGGVVLVTLIRSLQRPPGPPAAPPKPQPKSPTKPKAEDPIEPDEHQTSV